MDRYVITIGRQFGSGGRSIGEKLAKKLNIAFYDKELISIAAKESGMDPEVFEGVDEKAANSLLYSLVKRDHISVNSMHHQAVLDPAPGFRVSARAEDGLIEAVEQPDRRFFLGVQWHPEHMWQDYRSGREIWRGLVEACK